MSAPATAPAKPANRAHSGFRPDIQGLRAVAVGAVLLYHANMPFISGGFVGVDVFFVISGYLITGLLMREALATGRLRLGSFYAKRARRILPAATLVLVVTAVLTIAVLPEISWQSIGTEIVGAAFYVANWVFAANTDYLNADVAASPVQHFWTLSVEEQFYIVWPLLLVALLFIAARWRGRSGRQDSTVILARIGVLAILVPSLVWSVYYTATSPAPAYFVSTTRLWELAIGAAVAVFAAQLERIPRAVGVPLGWIGCAGIITACFAYSSDTAFPGSAALLPTLSAAAVIVGGMSGRATIGVGALLSVAPMRWFGDISYSLYLWHWPLVIVATQLLDGVLPARYGLIVVVLSIIPAWLSYKFVENPFRDWERLKASVPAALKAGGALMLVTALVGVLVFIAPRLTSQGSAGVSVEDVVGAEALRDGSNQEDFSGAGGFAPSAIEARDDNPVIYENGCHVETEGTEAAGCVFGDENSDRTVALVGDSHAASWQPTLAAIAELNGWRLEVHTKSACSFSDVDMAIGGDEFYEECSEWNANVMDRLTTSPPDLVVTVNSSIRRVWDGGPLSDEDSAEAFSEGLHGAWEKLNQSGIPVAAVHDTPYMGIDIPECVSEYPEDLAECDVPRAEAVDGQPQTDEQGAAGLSGTEVLDLNHWICPESQCSPVIGNALVWRDGHHLTKTYAETLAGPLEEAFRESAVVPEGLIRPAD